MVAGDRSQSRTLGRGKPDDTGAALIGIAECIESAERRGEHDIANLLQESLEEDTAADKKLNHVVAALGLLLASLDSPPRK